MMARSIREAVVLYLHEVAVGPEDVPVLPRRATGALALTADEEDPELGMTGSPRGR